MSLSAPTHPRVSLSLTHTHTHTHSLSLSLSWLSPQNSQRPVCIRTPWAVSLRHLLALMVKGPRHPPGPQTPCLVWGRVWTPLVTLRLGGGLLWNNRSLSNFPFYLKAEGVLLVWEQKVALRKRLVYNRLLKLNPVQHF